MQVKNFESIAIDRTSEVKRNPKNGRLQFERVTVTRNPFDFQFVYRLRNANGIPVILVF